MKTIKTFENDERLVRIIYFEDCKRYAVTLATCDCKTKSTMYKLKFYAERKFSEYKNHPLEALGVK